MRNFLLLIGGLGTIAMACLVVFLLLTNGDGPQSVHVEYVPTEVDGQQVVTPFDFAGELSDAQKQAMQQQFNSFTDLQNSPLDWEFSRFILEGTEVPQLIGLDALGVTIPESLAALLDTGEWGIYRCFDNGVGTAQVIRLKIKFLPDYRGNLNSDLIRFLSGWERDMLANTASVLFPHNTGDLVYLDGFSATDARITGVERRASVLVSGAEREISYTLNGDFILVGGDSSCLQNISNELIANG